MQNQSPFTPIWRRQVINSVCFIIIFVGTITLAEIITQNQFNCFSTFIHPMTALSCVISGWALYLIQNPNQSRSSFILSISLALILALISCELLIESILSFGYFTNFFNEKMGFVIQESLSTSINFILISIGLLIAACFKNTKSVLLWICFTIFFVSIFSLFQLIHMVRFNYVLTELTRIPVLLTILFVLYSIALALTKPNEKYIGILIGNSVSGRYARKILLYTITIPIIINYAENLGERHQLYDPNFGNSMVATISMLLIMLILIISARKIHDEEDSKMNTESYLKYITFNDPTSGSLNRHGFQIALDDAISSQKNKEIIVLKMNINQIDLINHVIGFEATSILLRQLVERYKKSLPFSRAVIGRLDQYRFVFFINKIDENEDASVLANKLLEITSEPSIVNEKEIILSSSIGISIYPKDGSTSQQLLQGAYAALLQAEKQGGNSFQFCTSDLINMLTERLEIENDLQFAITENQFQLYYQPQFDLKDGSIAGAEALLRWIHPKKGLVNPETFISIAEETDLILPIGEWIFSEVCRQIKSGWLVQNNKAIPLAINVSTKQFKDKYDIVSVFKNFIHQYDIKPSSIEIEVTESILLYNIHNNLLSLFELKEIGFHIALDDFGTGYSSFNYLSQIPNDKIKIDKSFIDRIQINKNDITVVTAIVAMAHALGKKVIAEGVENKEQVQLLKDTGCDYIQGNYYSPALSLADFKKFIRERTR